MKILWVERNATARTGANQHPGAPANISVNICRCCRSRSGDSVRRRWRSRCPPTASRRERLPRGQNGVLAFGFCGVAFVASSIERVAASTFTVGTEAAHRSRRRLRGCRRSLGGRRLRMRGLGLGGRRRHRRLKCRSRGNRRTDSRLVVAVPCDVPAPALCAPPAGGVTAGALRDARRPLARAMSRRQASTASPSDPPSMSRPNVKSTTAAIASTAATAIAIFLPRPGFTT